MQSDDWVRFVNGNQSLSLLLEGKRKAGRLKIDLFKERLTQTDLSSSVHGIFQYGRLVNDGILLNEIFGASIGLSEQSLFLHSNLIRDVHSRPLKV